MAHYTTDEVLRDEAEAIRGSDAVRREFEGKTLDVALNGLKSAALCLSGGGIRSAAFSLGVIQALATNPRPRGKRRVETREDSLLSRFHYLSTVSGGGYAGGWLSAWLSHEYGNGRDWTAVWGSLAGDRRTPEEEPSQFAWLRSYSNYLTPRLGLASADAWASVALSLRNLILNWLVILPALCAALIILKLVASAVVWVSQFHPQLCSGAFGFGRAFFLLVAAAGLGLVLALRFTTRNRPTRGGGGATQDGFLRGSLAPAVAAGVLLTVAVATPCAEIYTRNGLHSRSGLSLSGLGTMAAVAAGIFVLAWLAAHPRRRSLGDSFRDLAAWAASGAIYGVALALGLYAYFILIPPGGSGPFQPKEILLLTFVLPFALVAQLVAEMIFVGLTSYQDGSDEDREWLARAAGWYLVTAVFWALTMVCVYIGSNLASDLYGQVRTWLIGGGASLVTAYLGKSALSPAKGPASGAKGLSANLVLAVAAPVFAIALVIAVSALIDRILFGTSLIRIADFSRPVTLEDYPGWPGGPALVLALAVVVFIGAFASWRVNVNRFSLHALYRNRIIRAFLGASNPQRKPNPFTLFDEGDNLSVHAMWAAPTGDRRWPPFAPRAWRPFHIINIALNIVSTRKLAWQERKAEPFTVSPLHCGSSYLGYRDSREYGGPGGISLGTAVAISGAAASPNMGYHSSPTLAFLLTLFNVRLGWWLGNPGEAGDRSYTREGPAQAITPLLAEMFGLTTDDRRYVYLSDGGHFENLGLYEMIRRRCRFILVVDAGCDKNFEFEDLGNAVRKAALDLGVRITFRGLSALQFRASGAGTSAPLEPPFHAVGTIHYREAVHYREVDGGGEEVEDGIILYLKPAFHGGRIANVAIRNYAAAHPDFPHETTGDQWFSESQFEAYRALGFESADAVLGELLEHPACAGDRGLEEIFAAARETARAGP